MGPLLAQLDIFKHIRYNLILYSEHHSVESTLFDANMTSMVPAIDRAIRVLYLFKENKQKEYGVSEISRLLDLNKSTVHNILNTLAHHNFLVQNEATRRYRLGAALVDLGNLARNQIDIREIARPHLRRLMEHSGETILLGIFEGTTITIVDKEEPLSEVRVAASIGMKLPFCAGAFGQAFLAFMPAHIVDRLLVEPGLKAFTPTSITDVQQYRSALASVRAQGYALDDNQQYLLDVGAIAVPVFAPGSSSTAVVSPNTVVGVIVLVSFCSRLTTDRIAELTPAVVAVGQQISQELGVTSSSKI